MSLNIPIKLTQVYFSPKTWEEYQIIYLTLIAYDDVIEKQSDSKLLYNHFKAYPEIHIKFCSSTTYKIIGYKKDQGHRSGLNLMSIDELKQY